MRVRFLEEHSSQSQTDFGLSKSTKRRRRRRKDRCRGYGGPTRHRFETEQPRTRSKEKKKKKQKSEEKKQSKAKHEAGHPLSHTSVRTFRGRAPIELRIRPHIFTLTLWTLTHAHTIAHMRHNESQDQRVNGQNISPLICVSVCDRRPGHRQAARYSSAQPQL